MSQTIFTATGCARCKIAKKFMEERGIAYQELDIKGDGKDTFAQFYRVNRSAIIRSEEGVEFPVLTDGRSVRQGVGVVVGYLQAGTALDGFIGRSRLSKGWMDGIHVSGGVPSMVDDLVAVLGFLKKNGLKLQLDTCGKNASVLERLLDERAGDRVIMEVKGPLPLYGMILGEEIDAGEVKRSIELTAGFPEYRFETVVAPFIRQRGEVPEISYLTPEEIGETARLIGEVRGGKKEPYLLKAFDPAACTDERFKSVEKLLPAAMFKYRTVARQHQVLTEIEKV